SRSVSHSRRPPIPSREQLLPGDDQQQQQQQLPGQAVERVNRRGAPPVNANSGLQHQKQQQQQQQQLHHHPPGAPRPGPDTVQMETRGGSKSTGINSGSGRFLQPRPAPPSYQQVVSLTRYGQQQQQQQQQQRQAPMATQERPLPPQRSSAALSNPTSRQSTNPNGIAALRSNATTVSTSEPRKCNPTYNSPSTSSCSLA
ncbi:hypothetical protein FBUS_03402, partial [Fasciolopsis buskii]